MSRASRAARTAGLAAALVAVASACSWAPSDFAKGASDAASTFAAAETTLRLRHSGQLTLAYSEGSFVNYRDALEGLDAELAKLDGAQPQKVEQLVAVFRAAQPALDDPCLENDCDWQSQIASLSRAKEAFLDASEQ